MKDINIIFNQKKIIVMGLGITGIPVTKMLMELGNHIVAFDNDTGLNRDEIYSRIGKTGKGNLEMILADEENIDISLLEGAGLIIASPGIPSENSMLRAAADRGIPVWDELELSWRLLSDKQRSNTIAITGTNGKTTVVNLTGAILRDAGMKVEVCGNVGRPLLNTIKIDKKKAVDDDIIRVIETSSFQLERTYTFKPRAGILLNITSDHMDRHRCIEDYADIKLKLFSNQDISDYAIVNMDDSLTAEKITSIKSRENGPSLIKYSIEKKKGSHMWSGGSNIYYDFLSYKGKINIKDALLAGMHNTSNAMAASAASLVYGASPENTGTSIKDFKPLSHRMEYIGEIAGIRCINDSKSTNPDSTIAALKDFTREVTLIMGGKDKNMDFLPLLAFLDSAVNYIILIGQSAPYMEDLFKSKGDIRSIFRCDSLEEAVRLGFKITARGDVLLLSPGCASMDMFRDYRDRGDRFKRAVMSFKE